MEIPDENSPQLPIHDAISPGKRRPPTNIRHSRPPKRRGEEGELAFMRRAIAEGSAIAKPWGDSERYDFILDSGHGFWRVQVKSTQRCAESRYRVKAAGWKATYTRDEIDFLVAWVIPEDLWYVVPIQAFASRKRLRFYPHGERQVAV